MKRSRRDFCVALASGLLTMRGNAIPKVKPRVLAFYSAGVERDHVMFAEQAVKFFGEFAAKGEYEFASTSNWDDLNETRLKDVRLVMWFNDSPHKPAQRTAFESYMEKGGGWIGFHAAAYNDESTDWPWFVRFLGGAVFFGNNWPPLPAKLDVDDRAQPVTRHLPAEFQSPANEWYIWKPSPRENHDVKVLVTLAPSNYPIGLKDTIEGGDVPVVWANAKYRMIYMNMGHGDKIFDNLEQNRLFEDAVGWLIRG